MHRRSLLLVALALYVAARVAVLLTGFDEVAIPVYEVPSMGNAAWLASTGWRAVHWSGSYDNAGGQVLTAWLAAPLYVLFGNRYVALKLVPLLLGAALLALLWRTAYRLRGPRAANLVAFAFALAPPLLFKYSLLAKGNHFEGLFFVFLPVWLLFEAEGRPRRGPYVAAAGLAAGFAVSVYIGSLATLAALAVALLSLRGPRGALGDVLVALPGFLLGLAPAVVLHFASTGRTGAFVKHITGVDGAQKDFWGEARELATVHLPHATCCEALGPIPGRGLDALYLAATLAAFVLVWLRWPRVTDGTDQPSRRAERAFRWVVLIAPLVALAALLFTPLRVRVMPPPAEVGGLRYFVPFHFWSIVALALAAAALLDARARTARALGVAFCGAYLLAGLSSLTLARPSLARAELALSYPGNHLRLFSTVMGRSAMTDPVTRALTCKPEAAQKALDALAPLDRADVAHSLGSRLSMNAFYVDPKFDLEAVLAPIPAQDRGRAAQGTGAFLATLIPARADARPSAPALAAIARLTQGPRGEDVAFGLGGATEYPLHLYLRGDFQRARAAAELVGLERRAAVLRGLGADCGRRIARGARLERAVVDELARDLDEGDAGVFWEAVEAELRTRGRALDGR